jgi:ribonuclease R
MIKLKLLNHLSSRIGQRMEGVVTGVEGYGLVVQGLEVPAEGLVHISSMNEDRYFYDSRSHTLNGHRAGNQFRLGDRVRVVIAKVDLDRRQLDLQLVGHTPRGDRRDTASGPGSGDAGSGDAGGSGSRGSVTGGYGGGYRGGKAKHRRGGSTGRGRRRG